MSKRKWKAKLKKAVSDDGTKIDFENNLNLDYRLNLTDSAVIALLNETSLENVLDINLFRCIQITDETVHFIAQNCPNLEYINLYNCKNLMDDSFLALAEKCPLLKSINVYW